MPLTHVRVASLGRLKVKAFKYTLNIRVVVDSDHHFAFAAMHEGGHAFVVSKREVDAAPCRLPAGGGGHVMEGVRPAVAFSAFSHGRFST